jgi:hypothetical protein
MKKKNTFEEMYNFFGENEEQLKRQYKSVLREAKKQGSILTYPQFCVILFEQVTNVNKKLNK